MELGNHRRGLGNEAAPAENIQTGWLEANGFDDIGSLEHHQIGAAARLEPVALQAQQAGWVFGYR
jgi:hypothetical protein